MVCLTSTGPIPITRPSTSQGVLIDTNTQVHCVSRWTQGRGCYGRTVPWYLSFLFSFGLNQSRRRTSSSSSFKSRSNLPTSWCRTSHLSKIVVGPVGRPGIRTKDRSRLLLKVVEAVKFLRLVDSVLVVCYDVV